MRVHAIQTGRILFKPAVLDGRNRLSILGGFLQKERIEIPMVAWLVEHPDGHVMIDTGATHRIKHQTPRFFERIMRFEITGEDEVGPSMRAIGLRPEDVRLVIPTHLDTDHAGGLGHFPDATVLLHRPEYEYASTFAGKKRYMPTWWPESFRPTLYDLMPEPLGPFPESLRLTDHRDVTIVPIPGHSIAQVGIVMKTGAHSVFFTGDHMVTQERFLRMMASGRYARSLHFHSRRKAIETSRRIASFVRDTPTILVPTHEVAASDRVASLEVATL
jgi:glyoxylase-like metal-dependent hydrolase (beta-lactamase superfamily II)